MELTGEILTKEAFLNGEMFIHESEKDILISSFIYKMEKTDIEGMFIVASKNRDTICVGKEYDEETFTFSVKGLGIWNKVVVKFNNYLIVKQK
jgi:hypothetical protein